MPQQTPASSGQFTPGLNLKVAALEESLKAQGLRIDERATAVEALARTIAAASEQKVIAAAGLIESQLSGVDKRLEVSIETHGAALKLQATEYQRRFDLLDGAVKDALKSQNAYVRDEVFQKVEEQRREMGRNNQLWRESVDKELNVQRGKNSGWASAAALLFSVLSFIGMLVALYSAFAHKAT
jgi:hypothetical protein